jgi:hypothetical protein
MVADGLFVTGLMNTYCEPEDVTRILAGCDVSALGDSETLAQRILDLIGCTYSAVNREARRDFGYHQGDRLLVDGSGNDCLCLGARGVCPILAVQEVSLEGAVVPATDYAWYGQEGSLRLRPEASQTSFPKGVQNVGVVLDWGFVSPPGEIRLAQAKVVAAQILAEVSSAKGAVQTVRIGDYAVSYAGRGEHAATIERWLEDARHAAGLYRSVRVAAV